MEEARILQANVHPNIVRFLFFDVCAGVAMKTCVNELYYLSSWFFPFTTEKIQTLDCLCYL